MPNPEETRTEDKTEEAVQLSYEVLAKQNAELEAKVERLEKMLVDTQKVVRNNLTTTTDNSSKVSPEETHEKLRKKLYSNLKIKTE